MKFDIHSYNFQVSLMVVVLGRKMYSHNTAVRTTVKALHLFQQSLRILSHAAATAAGIQTQKRLPRGINTNIGKAAPCDAECTAFV
jgi:hypothetical protein